MLLSARNNQFKFNFPRNFVPKPVADRYKPFLTRIPGGLIKEPIDFWNYGIQSINLPGPSFDPVQQNDFPGNTRNFRASVPKQELFDKKLTVTMQAFDGYVNYWMAVEMFDYYYKQNGRNPFLPEGVGIQMLDSDGTIFVTVQLKDMIMDSVGSLDLNFSSNTVEFETFEIGFTYNILDIAVNVT
tara:strand:+ start:629 stop:1183 length:555 start_codon:yes stop_codon:yes gene_type:complete